MQIETLKASGAPAPGGAYSQGIQVGELVVLSGQVGIDPTIGAVPKGVAAQTKQALANLDAVLRVAGGSLGSLIKTTCFLTQAESFAEFNGAYESAFGDHRPARSTVIVSLAGGYLVEIEGIAMLPRADASV